MRVLVTGSEGYIGARLVPILKAYGLEVHGLDTGFYRDGWLFSDNRRMGYSAPTKFKDLRNLSIDDVSGFDGIVHLAELSNDPLGQNDPSVTHKINHVGSVALAELARKAGVERFVYTSSCSVYGAGSGDFLDESSPTNPQTAYAECKVLVERDVSKLKTAGFSPVFLRNATAYGPSPRMRFDIVINDLCALAWTTRRIAMISDGSPWRPVVHVDDICEAVYRSLIAPSVAVSGKIFNVGQNSDNYRIREIAQIVSEEFPGCELSVGPSGGDTRSYRVNFDRIASELPGFRCRYTARDGARQLREVFERIQMDDSTYKFRAYTRLKQLKYLQSTRQVDGELFWV